MSRFVNADGTLTNIPEYYNDKLTIIDNTIDTNVIIDKYSIIVNSDRIKNEYQKKAYLSTNETEIYTGDVFTKDPFNTLNSYYRYTIEKELLRTQIPIESLEQNKDFLNLLDVYSTADAAYESYISEKALANTYNRSYIIGTSKYSYTEKVLNIIKEFKDTNLKDKYPILGQLAPVNTKKAVKLIQLNDKQIAKGVLGEIYINNLINLANPIIKKVDDPIDNQRISDAFKDFSLMMFYQHGVGSSKLGFVNAIDPESYMENITKFSQDFLNNYLKDSENFSGQMTFAYDKNKRSDIKSTTTFDAILAGERTATTRYSDHKSFKYWKNAKVGDIITWDSGDGRTVDVVVTKALSPLVGSGKNAEQWSKLEGWSVDYFNKKVKPKLNTAWQLEYKLYKNPLTDVYNMLMAPSNLFSNFEIKDTKDEKPLSKADTLPPLVMPGSISTSNNVKTISEPYGVVVAETLPSESKTKQFVSLIQPQIQAQAYQENNTGNKMFMYGLRWTRKTKALKPLNNKSYANKGLSITDAKAKDGYVYDTVDQNGNSLAPVSDLQPIITEIEKSLGIDMSNYDAVIGNIYLPGQRIQTHRDTTESLSARNYPVVVYTIGAGNAINIYENIKNPGSDSFASDKKTSIPTKNGTIYTFGMDGKGRFELGHDTPSAIKKGDTLQPIVLPDGTIIKDYTITLTFRRAADIESGMPSTPKKLTASQPTNNINNSNKPVLNSLPNKSSVSTMTYAGIGSRQTPQEVLNKMTEIAKYLDGLGYTLQTGFTFKDKNTGLDEEGADKAFSDGAENKILFGPSGIRKTVNGETSLDTYNPNVTTKSTDVVKEVHPAPEKLSPGALKLMARNTNQIFGKNLDSTVDFVIFYAPETNNPLRPKGGTGQAVEMARRKGIPTINLANSNWREDLKTTLANRSTQPSTKIEVKAFRTSGTFSSTVDYAQRGSGTYYALDKPFQELGRTDKVEEVNVSYNPSKTLDATTEEGQSKFMEIKRKAVEGKTFDEIKDLNDAVSQEMMNNGYESLIGWIDEDVPTVGRELVIYPTQSSTTVKGINIYTKSLDKLGRELTNPNSGAKNIMDIEAEYKANASKLKAPNLNAEEALRYDMNLMYKLQMKKFKAHPELIKEITDRGGVAFLEASTHTKNDGTPITIGSRWEGKGTNSNFIKVLIKSYEDSLKNTQSSTDTNYQLPQNRELEEYVASEKTIRDLAARMSDRIGIPFIFESDRSKEYKGKLESDRQVLDADPEDGLTYGNVNNTAVINLAYATLDTPIHEILGHPIIRAIKNKYTKRESSGYDFIDQKDTRNNTNKSIALAKEAIKNPEKYKKVNFYHYLDIDNNIDIFGTDEESFLEQANKYINSRNKQFDNQLYQNLLKELETGKGKEVLDRIKRDYNKKFERGKSFTFDGKDYIADKASITGYRDKYGDDVNSNELETALFAYELTNKDKIYYSLEEQQEEALVELLGMMTAGKLDAVKDGNLISLLKRLLKEIKAFVKDLLKQKEIEINKLPDNMTLGDISDILAYSNSKLILPGNEVEYTTPDNQKFKTYQEASNHISQLTKSIKDVDLDSVKLNLPDYSKLDQSKIYQVQAPNGLYRNNQVQYITVSLPIKKDGSTEKLSKDQVEKAYKLLDEKGLERNVLTGGQKFWVLNDYESGLDGDGRYLILTEEEALNLIKNHRTRRYNYNRYDQTVEAFIAKNKEYEQSKEIIDEWKKINNIQYKPEEIYSRGQEFTSVVGAYSNFDVNLMMQNLLSHIEDNEKAGGKFAISAYTKPTDKKISHLEGWGSKIKFKIYPQSQDILWAANIDVYSGSVWDASEKVNKDKKSELLGVSYTKYPSLDSINAVQPNLASIVDDIAHHHNELGISLTGNNFRLEYDDDIPNTTKKIIDSINSILDQKYGKVIKPEIKKQEQQIIKYGLFSKGANDILDEFNTKEEAQTAVDLNNKLLIDGGESADYSVVPIKNIGIQPTQTNDNIKEDIESIKEKIREQYDETIFHKYSKDELEIVPFEEQKGYFIIQTKQKNINDYPLDNTINIFRSEDLAKAHIEKNYNELKTIKPKPDYTTQALINTKIAALKEVAKKYPRTLIRSEVKPINELKSFNQFEIDELPFQKLKSKSFINNNELSPIENDQEMFNQMVNENNGEYPKRFENQGRVWLLNANSLYDSIDDVSKSIIIKNMNMVTGQIEPEIKTETPVNQKELFNFIQSINDAILNNGLDVILANNSIDVQDVLDEANKVTTQEELTDLENKVKKYICR
jgi:alkylated DNA repair dioxygenase AlkB